MWDKSLNSCNKFCGLQAVFQADLMKWNYYTKLLLWTNKASNLITNGVIMINITPLVNYKLKKSTLAWWTPCNSGYPDNTDRS